MTRLIDGVCCAAMYLLFSIIEEALRLLTSEFSDKDLLFAICASLGLVNDAFMYTALFAVCSNAVPVSYSVLDVRNNK